MYEEDMGTYTSEKSIDGRYTKLLIWRMKDSKKIATSRPEDDRTWRTTPPCQRRSCHRAMNHHAVETRPEMRVCMR